MDDTTNVCEVIYEVLITGDPFRDVVVVQVYEDGNARYEWRIVRNGRVMRDTGREGGREYWHSEEALRDALMVATYYEPRYARHGC